MADEEVKTIESKPSKAYLSWKNVPRSVQEAFAAWRDVWIASLPEKLQGAITARPKPHVTLLFGCSGDQEACMSEVAKLCAESKSEQAISFCEEVFISPTLPVIFVPLRSCDTILRWFTHLFESQAVNPLGAKSPMVLNKGLAARVNPSDVNPHGFVPHMTVAWFDKTVHEQLLELPEALRHVQVKTAPFALQANDIIWKSLSK